MSEPKVYQSLEEELSDMEDDLVEYVHAAIQQALKHGNKGAATLLLEIADAAFLHIEKPAGFDDAVNDCLGGPPTPEDYNFGQFRANVGLVKHQGTVIEALKSGAKRPAYTEPKTTGGLEEVRSVKLSDKANALRLLRMYGDDLRHARKQWYEWDLRRWQPNEKAAHLHAADVGNLIREELLSNDSRDEAMATFFYRAAKTAESARGVSGTLDLAHSMPALNGDDIKWDSDPWALNCQNGTLDLKTGELHKHTRGDYNTRLVPTPYNPKATATRWLHFLEEVFAGDTELIDYLQWALGYSITGLQTEHVFFICHGSGANGKSTMFQTLRHVLGGDYFHTLDPEVLMLQKHARHLSPLAQLQGKRLVVAIESSENRRLNESLVKQLTGGDVIRANLMHRDAEEFEPELKLWLLTNHRPVVRDDTYSTWRRIRLLPFTQQFKGDQADINLGEKLRSEAQGILAWLVEGAKRALDGEPPLPEAVKVATTEYRAEEDTLARFLEDECETTWEHATVTASAFYAAYKVYMNGRCESQRAFGQRIIDKGFERIRLHGGVRAWKGIRLKDHDDNDLQE